MFLLLLVVEDFRVFKCQVIASHGSGSQSQVLRAFFDNTPPQFTLKWLLLTEVLTTVKLNEIQDLVVERIL